MTRETVRSWLFTLGVVAVGASLFTSYEDRFGASQPELAHVHANPGDMPFTEDYKFGWHFSPLAHYHNERTLTVADGRVTVAAKKNTSVDVLSWSGLTLAVGVGLLWTAKRLPPAPPIAPQPVS